MQPDNPAGQAPQTDPQPLTVDAHGVAVMLGLAFEQAFLTRRRRLEKHGFPRPLPMTPLRWSRAAVETWIRDSGFRERVADWRKANDKLDQAGRNPTVVALENWRAA
jgi:hypothetical protein